jgi:hypothetical protein
MDKELEQAKHDLQAAVRGDDAWRHPDLHDRPIPYHLDEEQVNMAAPIPPEYAAAHEFMTDVFGEDGYTPDAIGQLVEVFIPCLRIIIEHGWEPSGELWRRAGLFSLMDDVYKKFERYWYRTWKLGRRHDDSGFDLINFTGFTLRIDPNSRWGDRGEPARNGEHE